MKNTKDQAWVLYDDDCGFCRRWVPYWKDTLERRGFKIAPLQSPWVAEATDLPADELVDDLGMLLADGGYVQGADVYRHVMKRIWWAYPFYVLSVTPVLRSVFDWCYRTFARNRFRFSKACGLPSSGAGPPKN